MVIKSKTNNKRSIQEKGADSKVTDPFAEVVDAKATTQIRSRKIKAVVTKTAKPAARTVKTVDIQSSKADSMTTPADPFLEKAASNAPLERKVSRSTTSSKREQSVTAATKKPVKRTVKKSSKIADAVEQTLTGGESGEVPANRPLIESRTERSPVFKALADVELPALERRNQARLLMQSPTRLYFYWSVRENPWKKLRSVFGSDLGSYVLVLKLVDLKRDVEKVFPADAEGNWWFDVESDGSYQAEIGFYAPNRPYFRIIYSNSVTTPRRGPSPRPASEAQWTVSANKFAEVLDVAGFARDAYDVAIAGDDYERSRDASHLAFSSFMGSDQLDLKSVSAEDIRYAMVALASGATLEDIRWRVGPALFAILQANVKEQAAEKARASLSKHFDIDDAEWHEDKFGSVVYGASLINFPRTLRNRKVPSRLSERFAPVSSHSLR